MDSECKSEWQNAKCDKYDYLIAAFSGVIAGLIDAFFVGSIGENSELSKWSDRRADAFVQKVTKQLYMHDGRSSVAGKPKHTPDSIEKCISYLEQRFPVNYDARYASDLNVPDGVLSSMSSKNHHLISLSHSTDIIGLICSILDQFTGAATFVDNGKLIRVYPAKQNSPNKIPYMRGTNFESKLFCGFCNWIGHLLSDLVGSSSTRKPEKGGRGMGLAVPFFEIFQFCTFGNIDGMNIAEISTKIFEDGYDLRSGAAQTIPVFLNEIIVRLLWSLKYHFYNKKEWKECIPNSKHADLRMMLIISYGAFCVIDGVDAVIRSGGDILAFILRLNLVAWARFVLLVFKELRIRYGNRINSVLRSYMEEISNALTPAERKLLNEYYARMQTTDEKISLLLDEFTKMVNQEYRLIHSELEYAYDEDNSTEIRALHSTYLAKGCDVEKDKIIETRDDLDRFFLR